MITVTANPSGVRKRLRCRADGCMATSSRGKVHAEPVLEVVAAYEASLRQIDRRRQGGGGCQTNSAVWSAVRRSFLWRSHCELLVWDTGLWLSPSFSWGKPAPYPRSGPQGECGCRGPIPVTTNASSSMGK